MTTYDSGPIMSTGGSGPGAGGDGAVDQARQAASTAGEEARHLAQVAGEGAGEVAADAREQARRLLDQARTEVEQQGRTQLQSLVSTLQGFATDLETMAQGEGAASGLAQDVVREVGDKARSLSAQLQDREPGELLDQVRTYARRRPGTFLLGALAAGVVAGRLARGAKESASSTGSGGDGAASLPAPTATTELGTASGAPLAGVEAPPSAPASASTPSAVPPSAPPLAPPSAPPSASPSTSPSAPQAPGGWSTS